MRVMTMNLNGIRSAADKGFFTWMRKQDVDVLCLQEVRAPREPMTRALSAPRGYHAHYHLAEKPGYAGVGLWLKTPADRVVAGMGVPEIDREGRFLRADYGRLSVVSWYMPSGSSGPERQAWKYGVMEQVFRHLGALVAEGRELVVAGDWNIAHQPIDLENWRSNQKNSGFLPEERAWLDRVFAELGLVDVFRRLDPAPKRYTWWSNRGAARDKNVGWRLDYQLVTPGLAARATAVTIESKRRFSDHAPVSFDYAGPVGHDG